VAEAMKDRSNVAALAITLEAIVMTLARAHVATLDQAGRGSFTKEISESVDAICNEVAALAPATGRSANLSASAAKASAARIHRDALELVKDFTAELIGGDEP
jgi:hypothetical protein